MTCSVFEMSSSQIGIERYLFSCSAEQPDREKKSNNSVERVAIADGGFWRLENLESSSIAVALKVCFVLAKLVPANWFRP
jgi:hypothetical protein